VKERLLLDGIALHSPDVSPRDVELPATIEAHLADARLSVRNRTAVPARVASQAIAIELFDQAWIGLSNALIEDVAKAGHDFILRRKERDVCGEPDLLRLMVLAEPIIDLRLGGGNLARPHVKNKSLQSSVTRVVPLMSGKNRPEI
jgi:hypothetical protein